MKKYRWLAGALLFAGFLMRPELTANAAREAMRMWAETVAPSLLPFMMLMPALTCADAARAYEKLFGRLMQPLFGLPGAAAPAIVIAMTAGSPAGAIASLRIAASAGLNRGQLERIVLCTCGMSPAFLISGVGAGMLGSAEAGKILALAQIASQLTLLLVTRRMDGGEIVSIKEEKSGGAVAAILSVCGWMVLFASVAALLASVPEVSKVEIPLMAVLDVPTGAAKIAAADIEEGKKIVYLAACCGFGGLCICMQNLSAAEKNGVSHGKYVAFRMVNAGLMCFFATAGMRKSVFAMLNWEKIFPETVLVTVILLIPVVIFWINNAFLNKRISRENAQK